VKRPSNAKWSRPADDLAVTCPGGAAPFAPFGEPTRSDGKHWVTRSRSTLGQGVRTRSEAFGRRAHAHPWCRTGVSCARSVSQTVAMLQRRGRPPLDGYLAVDREHSEHQSDVPALQHLPTLKASCEIRTLPSHVSRVEVTPAQWRRALWNSRKQLRESAECGLHVARTETLQRGFLESWL